MNDSSKYEGNLYDLLRRGFPEDLSVWCIETEAGRRYDWSEVERTSAALANLLVALGLRAGDRVAVQVPKSPEALLLYLATLRAACVFLPLNTGYRQAEIEYFIGDAEPALVVCAPENASWIEPLARRHGVSHVLTLGSEGAGSLLPAAAAQAQQFDTRPVDDAAPACIIYTSGTTGRSKGAVLSHGNIGSNALVLHHYWRWRRGDVLLHALPIFHVHGLFVACHGALLSGSPMLWLSKFDARAVIERLPRATVFMGVPTMYVRLLDEDGFSAQATRSMRLFVSGSAPLLAATFRQFEERTGQRILERYGMSETVMLTSNPYDGRREPGTVGLPLPGVDLRIVDEDGNECGAGAVGAIQVRGPNVFAGYWRMPDKTREEFTDDGYFRTGDLGSRDASGYVSIVGRSRDLIISGGYNIYPKELELILDGLDGVAESAVIGLPDRDYGEAVAAVIVPAPGARPDGSALLAALKERIASFKLPRHVFVIDELPRNTMGKVQKNLLRERFARVRPDRPDQPDACSG